MKAMMISILPLSLLEIFSSSELPTCVRSGASCCVLCGKFGYMLIVAESEAQAADLSSLPDPSSYLVVRNIRVLAAMSTA
jgi:hypothetical protein